MGTLDLMDFGPIEFDNPEISATFQATSCTSSSSRDAGAWKCQIAEWRGHLGISETACPWSPFMEGDWCKDKPRVKAILDLVAAEHLGRSKFNLPFEKKKQLLQHVYCDTSQNPRYRAFTNAQQISPCLATSTTLYSFGLDRQILPVELLYLQGHSRTMRIPNSVKSNKVRDLAGEGMSLPCLGTILWALHVLREHSH